MTFKTCVLIAHLALMEAIISLRKVTTVGFSVGADNEAAPAAWTLKRAGR